MPTDRPVRSPGATLTLLGLASLITALDFTIVYVALPEIARDVGFSAHSLQWVVSAYAVVYGGLLLLGGRLADLLGRRRMFVTGMVLYGLGSVLGGLAGTPGPLIAARAVQGVGGAVLFPATLSLVTTMFEEGRPRNRALAVWSVAGAGGLSLGALLGGVLTSAFGWQAVFFVNVPLVVIAGLAAFVLLVPDPSRRAGGGFDVAGALTGTAGMTLLVFALAQGPAWGWGSARVLGASAAGVVSLAVFAAVERRARQPLLRPGLSADRGLRAATAVILVFGLTLQAVPYFLTLYFQGTMGYSALRTGVAFLGPTLSITVGNLVGERLVARLGVRGLLVAGFVVAAGGTALIAAAMTGGASYPGLLAGIVGFGLGTGVVFSTMWIAAASGVAGEEQGTASGLASTALQFGSGAGLAILVGVDGIRAAVFAVAAGAAVLGPCAALLLRPPSAAPVVAEAVPGEPGRAG
ncbi:MFS transporter [Yinghuangia sp. ASG 101]|uniref:MFS transporter n=1 Tax=Yinghuangia sp. ASG 101 TaxID=2896848 RepID=UPI001E48AC84|nr:MFS transporter [Yinghuangia sp. ASG 101]UGQ09277.1 MFS transporter [Yinghuangia sp. ASG 101]